MSSSPREATQPPDLRTVGRVGKPHGIRGEFAVYLESDDPDWLAGQTSFQAQTPAGLQTWRVTSARFHGAKLLLTVDAVANRDQAEAFRGTPLLLPDALVRDHLSEPDYFLNSDLVGLLVVDGGSGETHGRVRDVFEMPAQNLLEIEREDGTTFLVPFTKPIIGEVNDSRLVVHLPEGLVDCNRNGRPSGRPRGIRKHGRR